ncbi:MAG: hypothetical protein KDD68_20380, partial [Bdellovibrionales bacterium]|nr:hypothetical protein [Bdellovibrionales bacterium]
MVNIIELIGHYSEGSGFVLSQLLDYWAFPLVCNFFAKGWKLEVESRLARRYIAPSFHTRGVVVKLV